MIPVGLHAATVIDVSEPITGPVPSQYLKKDAKGMPIPENQTRFHVDWELESDDVPPGTVKWQWVNIPSGYFDRGELSPKSWVWKIMAALDYDMAAEPFRMAPREWIGKSAQLFFKPDEKDPEETVIGDVVAPKKAAPARQPVAAGRAGPARRQPPPPSNDNDWPDEE